MIALRNAIALCAILFAVSASADGYRARVTEVHNGHTVTVRDIVGDEMTVRLEGVQSPGRWRPFGARSRESLRALVKHKQVTIIPRSRDSRGRLTATILIDDVDAGLEQIRRGLVWYDDEDVDLPAYAEAERTAEREGVGVWSRR